MRRFLTLFFKEIKGYLLTPFGWIILSLLLFMQGLSMTTALEKMQEAPVAANFITVVFSSPNFWFYYLFLFPLLTMRLFAEESRTGTLESLLTTPVTLFEVIVSKYLASFCFYALLWLPLLLEFKLFYWITSTPLPYQTGHLLATYAMLFLIGAFFLALGLLSSTLTSSQIVSGIITVGGVVFFFFLGFIPNYTGENFAARELFSYISILDSLQSATMGFLDTRYIVYYGSMSLTCLYLTYLSLDFRRWKA